MTDGTFTQRTLNSIKISARSLLSDRQLDDAADKTLTLREEAYGLMMEVQREVYRHKVLDDTRTFSVPVQVQWSTSVSVTLPRTRWQRLLRRPATTVHQPVTGRTTGYGEVTVHAEHFAAFPALQDHYPKSFGSPVMWSDYRIDDSAWVRGQTIATPAVNERYDPPQPALRPIRVVVDIHLPSTVWEIDLNKLHLPIGRYIHQIIEIDGDVGAVAFYPFVWDDPTHLTIGPFVEPHTGKVEIIG